MEKLFTPTDRQIKAIRFIENYLKIKFTGSLSSKQEVSTFIGKHLDKAKQVFEIYEDEILTDAFSIY